MLSSDSILFEYIKLSRQAGAKKKKRTLQPCWYLPSRQIYDFFEVFSPTVSCTCYSQPEKVLVFIFWSGNEAGTHAVSCCVAWMLCSHEKKVNYDELRANTMGLISAKALNPCPWTYGAWFFFLFSFAFIFWPDERFMKSPAWCSLSERI
jgi:hypothetical protein